jgi:glyoxylase-like metal-dependent hydrolase (beta-lactamase superfamily II)
MICTDGSSLSFNSMPAARAIPLEDELGDVLDKALRCAGLNEEQLAERTGMSVEKIQNAEDYRYDDLTDGDLQRLAAALGLNEVGMSALARSRYPRPRVTGLPFCVHPLHMPFGVGVVNAYAVVDCATGVGILFDGGTDFGTLQKVWPGAVTRIEAAFLTHPEAEHIGGMSGALRQHGLGTFYGPRCGPTGPECWPLGEGETVVAAGYQVTAFSTPGHCAEHNCYLVRPKAVPRARALLVSGDLIFAGSLGGGYFSCRQLLKHAHRILDALPGSTVIAPGHGPMTTVANERKYNPFLG